MSPTRQFSHLTGVNTDLSRIMAGLRKIQPPAKQDGFSWRSSFNGNVSSGNNLPSFNAQLDKINKENPHLSISRGDHSLSVSMRGNNPVALGLSTEFFKNQSISGPGFLSSGNFLKAYNINMNRTMHYGNLG